MTQEPPNAIADCMLRGCQGGELRAEVERLTEAARRSDLYARSIQAELGAQVERQRDALEQILDASTAEDMRAIARAALEPPWSRSHDQRANA